MQWRDPGFPRGGGANSLGGGHQHMILPKFPKNCMKSKEFGPPGGARVPCAPLRSATAMLHVFSIVHVVKTHFLLENV